MGPRLPDDERDLLITWSTTRRGLFLIESVDRGMGFSARDALTGAVISVLGSSSGAGVGDLVCLRPLPASDSLAAPGGVVMVSPDQQELVAAMLGLQGTDEVDPIRTATVLTGAEH